MVMYMCTNREKLIHEFFTHTCIRHLVRVRHGALQVHVHMHAHETSGEWSAVFQWAVFMDAVEEDN